jgi:hypothetical protein
MLFYYFSYKSTPTTEFSYFYATTYSYVQIITMRAELLTKQVSTAFKEAVNRPL